MQVRRRHPSPGTTSASSHSIIWRACALQHLLLPMAILQGLSSSIPMLAGLAWGLASIRLMMMGLMLSAYASRSFTKDETQYPTHKLTFHALKWAMVKKFHEYLYGMTFIVYTHNNPLGYVLKMAKLEAMNHQWVASLANYNFQLYYRAGKTNIDADALSRVSWPRCMPKTLGTHYRVTAVAVRALQEAAIKGPTSSIKGYSCDLLVLDPVWDSPQVTCMTADSWH